jgi:hypothetical protein
MSSVRTPANNLEGAQLIWPPDVPVRSAHPDVQPFVENTSAALDTENRQFVFNLIPGSTPSFRRRINREHEHSARDNAARAARIDRFLSKGSRRPVHALFRKAGARFGSKTSYQLFETLLGPKVLFGSGYAESATVANGPRDIGTIGADDVAAIADFARFGR